MKNFIKIWSLFLIACFALSFFACSDKLKSASLAKKSPVYDDYKKIPGVTQAEIAAVEQLKKKYDKFTYGMTLCTECFYAGNGEIKGYSALFCDWLSTLFGIKFQAAVYEWSNLIADLSSHRLDFTGEITQTPERMNTFYMTDAIAQRSIKMISIHGSRTFLNNLKHRPMRYAFLKGATTRNLVAPFVQHEFEAVYVDSFPETYKLLKNGDIDAFFDEGTAEAAFNSYGKVVAEDFFPLIYTPVSMSSLNPELAPIISVVQKALRNGTNRHLITLYAQGINDYLKSKLYNQLTPQEEAYIQEHIDSGKAIPFTMEYDNYPVSFYNIREKEWQGIGVDVLRDIEKLTGLSFVCVNGTNTYWSTIMEMLKSGEASLTVELIRSADRENQFLWASQPYETDYYALLSKSSFPDVSVNEVLFAKVGLIQQSAYAEVFMQWFRNHQNYIEYGSALDAITGLQKGEIELLMASRNIILNMTNYLEMPGYKVNMVFAHTAESSFGFNKNEEILCSIFSKAQSLVDTTVISDRWKRKVFDYQGALARAQIPYFVGISLLFLVVIILLSVSFLRKKQYGKLLEVTVEKRTKELQVQTLAAERASRAAQVASQFKSEFLARMSHELRTPLNAIIGMAAIAKTAATREKVDASITEVEKASQHLLGVLNDVLDMSKIESGKFILAKEEFLFCPAMEEVASIIRQRCEDKNLEFITNIDLLPSYNVFGDKLRLKQVLINLLGNAVKFTGDGGKVSFLIDITDKGEQSLLANFEVSDTGIGISEEQQHKLFSAFEQADETIAVRFGGTGLGLSISQSLVGMMGGTITVKSALGEGSVFSFAIPLVKVDDNFKETPVDANIPDLSGKRILVVEDIEINRIILRELLAETNVKIDEADNGQEAIDKFSSSPEWTYDLILMDVQMPGIDGYEATRQIRLLPRLDARVVQIIAVTAHAYSEDIQHAFDAGMNSHLSKPINIQEIMKLLSEKLIP